MSSYPNRSIRYYQNLAGRLFDGTITPEERAELESWYNSNQDLDIELPENIAASEDAHADKLMVAIQSQIRLENKPKGTKGSLFIWLSIAAIVIVIIGAFWFLDTGVRQNASQKAQKIAENTNIVPGHTGAELRLANGKTIILDSLKDGVVLQEGDVKIVKENGQLKYIGSADQPVYNDVVTDRGRQWQMFLPDGTEVWLNAGSKLHFPISFKGQKQRVVELTGEAYFKVVHNTAQPFKVIAGNQIIEDIGTAFNVTAYEDDHNVKTTLIEGALKVNETLLQPGQQASTDRGGHLKLKQVDTDEITAWMNGQFSLDNVSFEEVMKQLSRWYDVDIQYDGQIPEIRLGGMLDKRSNLSDIIKSLNEYGVHIRLNAKTLIVSPE
ncbi:FecR family protein [Arachidicoccus terrestris]|uniref:FecR family protein n=1 Tax=Arachidicoccus terrestris TaxID=2875539 RepID=UPI001CC46D7E|nr:FecR domain-containing protein [Arachidicoccus terrestris]UAY54185.1 DUF4974 domain-containing protein [Arachidicoccus terrestris]